MYKFSKLDLFMIKPYLKKMVIITLAMSIPMIIGTGNPYIMLFLTLLYGVITVSYPFVLSEKNNIENFYGTLSVKKKDIVNGRYMFALEVLFLFSIIAIIFMVLGTIIIQNDFVINEMIFLFSIAFAIAVTMLSIQMPIFFKMGYAKGKLYTYLPFFIIGMGCPLIPKIIGKENTQVIESIGKCIENNSITIAIIIVLGALLLFELSNVISQKFYLKK